MYSLKIHKEAEKNLQKAPEYIREKAFTCVVFLRDHGTQNCPFPIKPLHGSYKKFSYYEAKIQKDYRIFFRIENQTLYIRTAGTHNSLGTG